jgi:hypothetical protein
MTFYIRLAFTSGLALRIKGAAYFTKSQRPETDNKQNVFVEKKPYDVNGRREMRTAKDFRRLNAITRSDAYPLEDIHAIV